MTKLYYDIDTSGEHTNLQLYSLKQAKKYWKDLEEEVLKYGEGGVLEIHERCIFIINTLGLSVSQLLGQNPTQVPTDRIGSPPNIFREILDNNTQLVIKKYKDITKKKSTTKEDIKDEFKRFNEAYENCRHFGVNKDNARHAEVSKLSFEQTKNLYDVGLIVWDIIIEVYKKNKNNDLEALDLDNIENV